jgi:hypothetical protein
MINDFKSLNETNHITKRSKRLQIANMLLFTESATLIGCYVIDTGHKNGLEVHAVYNNGVIKIYNLHTSKFITVLIARTGQMKRYPDIEVTKTMKRKIKEHVKNGYNEIVF